MERATRASSASSMAGSSAALGASKPLLHDLSQDPLLNIPDAQASRSHSPSLQVRRVKRSKQVTDNMDLKAQMAQVLELLAKQAMAAQASVQAPLQPKLPSPLPQGSSGWMGKGIPAGARGHAEEEPGFEVALSSSVSAFMGRAAAFLQVPWTPVAEPSQSVFRIQTMAPRPQKFPAFPDFMEEVRSSWDRPASGPSVLKQPAPLTTLEGAEKLGLAGFRRFCIDMGKDSNELALHFNPRFHDDAAGTVIVCNSKRGGCWGSEQRDPNFPFEKGATIKSRLAVLAQEQRKQGVSGGGHGRMSSSHPNNCSVPVEHAQAGSSGQKNFGLTVKVLGDCFEIELPNEHIVAFPNHLSLDKITYIRVKGDLKVTSFKFE
ncbi:UNVERIFIED_CONTAM: hypothetical protein FKN15_005736 [Acipenser sinensis]